MLEQDKIEEYTRLLKECEKAKQTAQNITTEINMLKKQGIEKLKEKGYKPLVQLVRIRPTLEEKFLRYASVVLLQTLLRTLNIGLLLDLHCCL